MCMKANKIIILEVHQKRGSPWNFSPYKKTFSTIIKDNPSREEIIDRIKFLIRKHRTSKDFSDYEDYDYFVKARVRKVSTEEEREHRRIFGRPYPSPPDWSNYPRKISDEQLDKWGFKVNRTDWEKIGSAISEIKHYERLKKKRIK